MARTTYPWQVWEKTMSVVVVMIAAENIKKKIQDANTVRIHSKGEKQQLYARSVKFTFAATIKTIASKIIIHRLITCKTYLDSYVILI